MAEIQENIDQTLKASTLEKAVDEKSKGKREKKVNDESKPEKQVKQKKEKVSPEKKEKREVKKKSKNEEATTDGQEKGKKKEIKGKGKQSEEKAVGPKRVKQRKEKKSPVEQNNVIVDCALNDDELYEKSPCKSEPELDQECEMEKDEVVVSQGRKRKNIEKGDGKKKKQICEIQYSEDDRGIKSTAHQKVIEGSILLFKFKRPVMYPVDKHPIHYDSPRYSICDDAFRVYGYVDTTFILESDEMLFKLLE